MRLILFLRFIPRFDLMISTMERVCLTFIFFTFKVYYYCFEVFDYLYGFNDSIYFCSVNSMGKSSILLYFLSILLSSNTYFYKYYTNWWALCLKPICYNFINIYILCRSDHIFILCFDLCLHRYLSSYTSW